MVQFDPVKFFSVGRVCGMKLLPLRARLTSLKVFATLFSEPLGASASNICTENISTCIYKEKVYTQIRRFVVVKEKRGNSLAW